ncbi:hypothetical protein TNIN_488781 [Trichonephila inaurata madagascariensis]|uniref:Uncharacterized protein n=1 Tax=Trichonephila inaurata madagascariensis TaxID=2747483 RepID=A0A8X6WZU4_9ARAC|nr:hypothetical protein TNIN_488781 [Trichonephila inaurata madagascariensis]
MLQDYVEYYETNSAFLTYKEKKDIPNDIMEKEEATPGFNECSKASGHDGVDITEFSYHTCLGNHIVNLKRLVNGLSLNTENSNSGESSNRAIVRLITALRCLKLKLVQAMSLLEVEHS